MIFFFFFGLLLHSKSSHRQIISPVTILYYFPLVLQSQNSTMHTQKNRIVLVIATILTTEVIPVKIKFKNYGNTPTFFFLYCIMKKILKKIINYLKTVLCFSSKIFFRKLILKNKKRLFK